MPMLRAVPSMMRIAASIELVLRSTSLVCAMSLTCCRVTFPILSLWGTADAFAMPAARLRSTAAGGVFTMNVNDRSWNIVTTTGRISPSSRPVWALNPLQNSMMLTPCWPSAGPTGGEGFALPAGICSFTTAWTFFIGPPHPRTRSSHPLHLVVLELDRRGSPEDRHHHLHPPALWVHVVDHTLEVDERPVDDAHLVAAREDGFGLGLLGAGLHLSEDVVDLVVRQRDGLRPRPDEPGDLGRRAHQVPRVVGQLHLDQHVPGEELLLGLALLLVSHLDDLFGRYQDARDLLRHPEDLGPRLDRLLDLILEPRIGVDDEPLLVRGRRRRVPAHRKILSTIRASTMSTPPRNSATTTVTVITTTVELISSWRLGHVTLRNSATTSRMNSCVRLRNSIASLTRRTVAGVEGFEPPSPGFGVRCSSR